MKKFLKVVPAVMMVCFVLASVYAIPTNSVGAAINGGTAAGNVTAATKNIWQTVVTIVQILAVAAIVFAGLRYMFASADQKADIKKSMGILAIGAVLVFGATLLIDLVFNATNSILQ